jgi:mersacidin/lichenicidin family type 2 lantibiotic
MAKVDVIRAWKDEEYRLGLSEAERASLPAHPAGLIDLDDDQMRMVLGAGAHTHLPNVTTGCVGHCTC